MTQQNPQQLAEVDAVGPRDPEDEFVSPLQGFVGPVGSEHCPAALQTLRAGQRERAVAMLTAREQARKLWWPGDDVGWTVEGMVPLRQWGASSLSVADIAGGYLAGGCYMRF